MLANEDRWMSTFQRPDNAFNGPQTDFKLLKLKAGFTYCDCSDLLLPKNKLCRRTLQKYTVQMHLDKHTRAHVHTHT